MADKVLFVDDEVDVLDGLRRTLRREFEVHIAVGGVQALAMIEEHGPFPVVVSDMRMPGMSGAQLLAKVRQLAPDTVRILLTGYTDLNSAIEAVNEGNIFRFLTKPCEKELLVRSISDAVEQYRLITVERNLLEDTLLGSIKVLADVLNAANPEAFGRSLRIARYVRHMVEKLDVSPHWSYEAAAALSQLGCVTLDSDLILRAYTGAQLSTPERELFNSHPQAAAHLLEQIPRLGPMAWMIGQQLSDEIPNTVPGLSEPAAKETVLGAKILKLAIAFDNLRMLSFTVAEALERLRPRHKEFPPELIEALKSLGPEHTGTELKRVATARLAVGMFLDQEIRNKQGMLLVPKGQEITQPILMRINNHWRSGTIDSEVMALVPAEDERFPLASVLRPNPTSGGSSLAGSC